MSKMPRLTGKQVIRALEKAGFCLSRQEGSHCFLRHPDGRTVTVPVHRGEDLGAGLLSKIMRDAEIRRDQLLQLLQ